MDAISIVFREFARAGGAPPRAVYPEWKSNSLLVCQLPVLDYRRTLDFQNALRTLRQRGEIEDTLLLLEHEPVYTRGRRSDQGELPLGEDFYRARGIEIVDTDRGGKLTYHGPGQLVGYPIMAVGDIVAFLRTMEGALINALAAFGVCARMREGLTGVWVGERKIGSIGLHVSRSITTHGFAINIENDLEPFAWVVPCGLDGVAMTSVAQETGLASLMGAARGQVARSYAAAHGREIETVDEAELRARAASLLNFV
jgi:lipoyl(octanoyl) transferase